MEQTTSHILMVRPKHFGFNVQTAENNVFQGNVQLSAKDIQTKAEHAFDQFVETLRQQGIHVYVEEDSDEPVKPDAIFPNNWFCSMQDGTLFVFPMFAPNRRLERSGNIISHLEKNFQIKKVEDWSTYEKDNVILEGTGSIVFDHINHHLFACISPRTDEMLVEKFAKYVGYKPIVFTSEDEGGTLIYHTNVMLHIGVDYAVVCLESIHSREERQTVLEKLSMNGRRIIDITLKQVHQYAGNMLQVNNNAGRLFTVLSAQAYASLSDAQRQAIEASSQLLPVDIGVIETIGGGSARCMMAEIFFASKNRP
ncbi:MULTISPECIES: citrulline utilization hydrolase CtlX [Chitinophagaceae]